jgi:hypothetical protein
VVVYVSIGLLGVAYMDSWIAKDMGSPFLELLDNESEQHFGQRIGFVNKLLVVFVIALVVPVPFVYDLTAKGFKSIAKLIFRKS